MSQKMDRLFTVRGRGPFPIEMLWEGQCYPASADDVDEIIVTSAPFCRCAECEKALGSDYIAKSKPADAPRDTLHEVTLASLQEQDLRRWIETGWVLVEKETRTDRVAKPERAPERDRRPKGRRPGPPGTRSSARK